MRNFGEAFRIVFTVALLFWAVRASAHQIWIEAPSTAAANAPIALEICFGHSGEKTTGPMLAGNRPKLAAVVKGPDGHEDALPLEMDDDGYPARFQPKGAGFYHIGAVLETGIIERELHQIPPKTRIVMTGKAIVAVGEAGEGLSQTLGHPLEILPVTNPCGLRVGDKITLRIVYKGKPIGGPDVLVRVGTLGPNPKDDPQLTEREWAIEGYPDSRGEVSFPLIAAGQHVVFLRYMDETPGEYAGTLSFSSDFSHLQPGDRYERTLYMTTLTFQVQP